MVTFFIFKFASTTIFIMLITYHIVDIHIHRDKIKKITKSEPELLLPPLVSMFIGGLMVICYIIWIWEKNTW